MPQDKREQPEGGGRVTGGGRCVSRDAGARVHELPMQNLPSPTNNHRMVVYAGEMATSGRGITWSHKETFDLLDIWGEKKVQEKLSTSHRNLDIFEQVAAEMGRRGHVRTAVECRNKTKTMRKEYRWVVTHNTRSGSGASTCPYYKELDGILHSDTTIRPKRVAGSLKITRKPMKKTPQKTPREGQGEDSSSSTSE